MNPDNNVDITQVHFQNFKEFQNFTINLRDVNILVGPNNSGKSTILNAFRVLAAGIRRANSKQAVHVPSPDGSAFGHYVPTEDLPISFENVHHDYDAQRASTITFTLSNKNRLLLYFPHSNECVLIPLPDSRSARNPSTFKKEFPVTVEFVPVLGPLEHNEPRVEISTVNRNLPTHRASRNFRNYWRYYSDNFPEFSRLLSETWPNMSILLPESAGLETIAMFCNENGQLRELYWAGFGFQVWCQLLTHIVRSRQAKLLIVDEPEIYLHPDLQRQLLAILRNAGPNILMATHSTEIIAEADPDEILVVDKYNKSAKRLRDIDEVQKAVETLGSSQNITLTQLARTRRVLFVEGTDFKLLSQFARVLDLHRVANQSNFTVVPTEGFSHWPKLQSFQWGFEKTMGQKLFLGAVFDRDYRCNEQTQSIIGELQSSLALVHFHDRKELENYLLVPIALEKAIKQKISLTKAQDTQIKSIEEILDKITIPLKTELQSQYIANRLEFFKKSSLNSSTITAEALKDFDTKWTDIYTRMEIVPGKEVFSLLNRYLGDNYRFSLSPGFVVRQFNKLNVPKDLVRLLRQIDVKFCEPVTAEY